jgi:CheY-like chemotaxis protein
MDLSELRTLVVDDNRHAAEIVKSILAGLGAKGIRGAATAHDAFEIVKLGAMDMIIVDQNLGQGDDGTQLVRRIRNDPTCPTPYVPILMLTGYTEHKRVIAARDAGVSEFLSKPFTVSSLVKRLDALIQSPRPFVRADDYFGPDRRRRADPTFAGPERRKTAPEDRTQQIPSTEG